VLIRGCPKKTSAVKGLSSADIFCGQQRRGSYSDADVDSDEEKKFQIFLNLCVSARTRRGGWASVDILQTKGREGSSFHDFVRTPFMGVPLYN